MEDGLQLFPALDPATEAALRSSIERFGVIVPATVDQYGRTLDGHHRQRIAAELGADCPVVVRPVADDGEAEEIARTLNMDRRHLDPETRRELAAHLREQGYSFRDVGAALGVDAATVFRDTAGVASATPAKTRGRDGKLYPSTKPIAEKLKQSGLADPDTIEDEAEAILDSLDWDAEDAPELDDVVEECIESKRLPITKPDLGGGISHPARYSDPLFDHFREMLKGFTTVLDPFAGTGRIHELRPEWETAGVELEPEWANLSPHTIVGNALALPFDDQLFDAVCTSPTYGNRLADHHNASDPHLRRSYTHDLGRDLHDDNSGVMQWGAEYRDFHDAAWREAVRVLRPGGRFVLNIKDHVRGGALQLVSHYHVAAVVALGLAYRPDLSQSVSTSNLRQGSNSEARTEELVLVFDRD